MSSLARVSCLAAGLALLIAGCDQAKPLGTVKPGPATATSSGMPPTGVAPGKSAAAAVVAAAIAPKAAVADYAAALAMVRPDHYALVKIDVAGLLASKFVRSFPATPEEIAKNFSNRKGGRRAPEPPFPPETVLDLELVCASIGPPTGMPEPGGPPFGLGVYARFKSPEAVKRVVEKFSEGATAVKHNGQEYFKPKSLREGPYYKTSDRELYLASDEATIQQVIDAKGSLPDVPLLKKLAGVNFGSPIIAAGSPGPMKEMLAAVAKDAAQRSPFEKAAELPRQLEWAVVAIHPDAEQVIDMDADMQGDQGAEQLKAELDKGLDMAKKQLAEAPPLAKGTAGADALELAKALVAAISVERNAKHVDVTLKRVPELAKAPEIVGRAIQEAQSAARRMMVQSNGRNLSMALLIGEQVTSKRPTNIVDAAGKPLLSWRVQILPYIEQGHIFNKLNPKEAWDSAQNRELHGQMPELLKSDAASEPNTTAWRMLPANSMGMELIEVGKGAAVSWMEPDELKIDPANPLAALGEAPPDGFIVAFKDGHMERVPAEKLKAALEKK